MMNPGSHPDRACKGADTSLFFPTPTEISEGRWVIKNFCARCPVMDACLEFAMEMEGKAGHSGRSGIYGGTTPRRRAEISRERRKSVPDELPQIPHGTESGYKMEWRRGIQPCQPCKDAQNVARRERKLKQRREGDAA